MFFPTKLCHLLEKLSIFQWIACCICKLREVPLSGIFTISIWSVLSTDSVWGAGGRLIVKANYSLSTLSSPCPTKTQIHSVFWRSPEGLVSPASRECVYGGARGDLHLYYTHPHTHTHAHALWSWNQSLDHGNFATWVVGTAGQGAGLSPLEKDRALGPHHPTALVGVWGACSWLCFTCSKNQNQRRKSLGLQLLL